MNEWDDCSMIAFVFVADDSGVSFWGAALSIPDCVNVGENF